MSHWMQHALTLAHAQLGQTWPNPAVGAVVIKNNRIVGEGTTQRGGRPHAETIALKQAGEAARGATLYVTLEPCAHQGQTPPCVDAIIQAAILHVYVACRDPNPLVNGRGIALLKKAGITVEEGLYEAQARELNRGFFSLIERNRPYIALKIAASADGKIASAHGMHSQITGIEVQGHVHHLRAQFDAILTGIGTVLTDDPLLTVRIPGIESRSPVRIVLDSELRIPMASKLVQSAKITPLWLIASSRRRPGPTSNHLENAGVQLFGMDPGLHRDDNIRDTINFLASRGITRLLIEGGQGVNSSFLQSGLVDALYYYESPKILGENGLNAVDKGCEKRLASLMSMPPNTTLPLGEDSLRIYQL